MSVDKEIIDTRTCASPPWSRPRNVASSPVYFGPSIELISNEHSDPSSIVLQQDR
jgi:hypothetical protein